MSILERYDGGHRDPYWRPVRVRERSLHLGPLYVRVGRYANRYAAAIEIGKWPNPTLLFKVSSGAGGGQ